MPNSLCTASLDGQNVDIPLVSLEIMKALKQVSLVVSHR